MTLAEARREIAGVDRAINANRRARPVGQSAIEADLFRQRGDLQVIRGQLAAQAQKRETRPSKPVKCPTCQHERYVA